MLFRSSLNMILEPSWKLLAIHVPIYLQAVGYGMPLERLHDDPELTYISLPLIDSSSFEDDEPGIEGMTRQLIDLIGTTILNPGIHPLLKAGLRPFAVILSSYLILTQEQLIEYKEKPFYFIEEQDTNVEIELGCSESMRTLCSRIIETLIETFGNITTEILLNIALDNISFEKNIELKVSPKKSISEFDSVAVFEYATEAYSKHEIWRKKELGLYLLGKISDDLLVALGKGEKFVNVDDIVNRITSILNDTIIKNNPMLLGRLLCTASSCIQLFPECKSIDRKSVV